jgi:hypothetical protein
MLTGSFQTTQARMKRLGVQESIIPNQIACQIDMSAPYRHLAAMLRGIIRFGKHDMCCGAIPNHSISTVVNRF